MRFVAGTSLDKCSTQATWRAAGHVLRTVHGAKPQDDHLMGGGFGLAAETWPAFVRILVEDSLDRCVRDLAFDPESATRIRRAFDDDLPLLEHAPTVWSHGDLQPEHVLLDPGNNDVVAIIDWADHGRADPAWDLAVLALDDTRHLDALLDGYASYTHDEHGRVRTRLNLYRVLRWLAEALWFAERSHPGAATSLERAAAWRREDQ
jgi:aminoglycoside phosphotransferase (APT) family kinase protein